MKIIIIFLLMFSVKASEKRNFHHGQLINSKELLQLKSNQNWKFFVEMNDGQFVELKKVQVQENRWYFVQGEIDQEKIKSATIPYYNYNHWLKKLSNIEEKLTNLGMKVEKIGTSHHGRNLHAIYPSKFDPSKKLVVILGRQHGDESTQNYIIDGMFDYLMTTNSWKNKFQFIFYPFINPDGSERKTRYNAKSLDLNRTWRQNRNYNEKERETELVHKHLHILIQGNYKKIEYLWDMHGSFDDDFIYRCKESLISRSYFQKQTDTIYRLGRLDPFQRGTAILSNGHYKMARIMFGQNYLVNALTHETPRVLPLSHEPNRSIFDLNRQGHFLIESMMNAPLFIKKRAKN